MSSLKINFWKTPAAVFFVSFLFSVSGCGGLSTDRSVEEQYATLCNIYGKVVTKPISLEEKQLELIDEIEKSLPVFFSEDYVNIITADRPDRYSLIQKSAQFDGHSGWHCDYAESFYEGMYD